MTSAKAPSLFILLLLVSFAAVSAVLFTPGLPQIAHDLGISESTSQMTISVFLLGYTFGLLPYSPLSDRFGRKPTVYLGICIAILGCFLTLPVQKFSSFPLLLAGRLLTALGSSVGLKIAFTMVGDVYQHGKATKIISYMMLSFAIAPALAIGIGGFLTAQFGWISCFYFQTAYSIFLLLLTFRLPETCQETNPNALAIKVIAYNYLQKIKNVKLITCALMMGCGAAVIYLFAAKAPFIGIEKIGLSPERYGLLNLIPPTGLIAGALLANYLSVRKAQFPVMLWGGIIAMLFALVMLGLFSAEIVNPWTLFLPMPFIYIGESLVYANASSLILTHAQNKSYASATMGFITMGSCVVTVFIAGALPAQNPVIMPLIITGIFMLLFLLLGTLWRMLKKSP